MKVLNAVRMSVAIGALLMTGAAIAQGPMGAPGMGPGMGSGRDGNRPPFERAFGGHEIEGRWWNNPRVIERLKLTEDQRKAFDQILLDHREKLIDLHANVEKAELAMEPLVQAEQPNESAILAQIDKVAQARAELEKAHARYLLALRGKLTPEQWKQVQDLRHNRDQMRDGWGPGGRRPGDDRGPGHGSGNGPNTPPPPPGAGAQGMLEDGPANGVAAGGAAQ